MGKAAPVNDLGPTLRELIAATGRRQREIAAAAGLEETALSALVNGRQKSVPRDETLAALATALGVSPDVLRAAQRRVRRTEGPPELPEQIRHAFRDVRFVTPEDQAAYWREIEEQVRSLNRKYVERERGLSHYPRRLK